MKLLAAIKRWIDKQFTGPWLNFALNFYPPFVGAGVRVRALSRLGYESSMNLSFWNENYHGNHFGGSIYAMCDPFFVLILTRNLGPKYLVLDKSATIRFRRPGRGKLIARFELTKEKIEELRAQVDSKGKIDADFQAQVRDASGNLIAEIDKVINLRVTGDTARS